MISTYALAMLCCWHAEDIESLVRWHEATLASIRSLRCQVEVTWQNFKVKRQPPPLRGEFWMHQGRTKVVTHRPTSKETLVFKEGRCFAKTESPTSVSLSIRTERQCKSFCHVTRYAGMLLDIPAGNRPCSLADVVRSAKRVRVAAGDDDQTIIELDVRDNAKADLVWRARIKLDRRYGYMVTEVRDEDANAEVGTREVKISDFAEFPGGVHFPQLIQAHLGAKGELHTIVTMRFSDLRVNEPIPASEFAVDFPHGAWVYDNIRGTRYQVDSAGSRISEETPLEKIVAVAVADEQGGVSKQALAPSTDEDGAPWQRLWWGSGGLMLLLLTYWLWQRQRS